MAILQNWIDTNLWGKSFYFTEKRKKCKKDLAAAGEVCGAKLEAAAAKCQKEIDAKDKAVSNLQKILAESSMSKSNYLNIRVYLKNRLVDGNVYNTHTNIYMSQSCWLLTQMVTFESSI
jgi:hypothetical protein